MLSGGIFIFDHSIAVFMAIYSEVYTEDMGFILKDLSWLSSGTSKEKDVLLLLSELFEPSV